MPPANLPPNGNMATKWKAWKEGYTWSRYEIATFKSFHALDPYWKDSKKAFDAFVWGKDEDVSTSRTWASKV